MPNHDFEEDDDEDHSPMEEVSVSVPEEQEESPDTDGPPRRQHKYSTANLQPERPWKRYLLICLTVIVIIVIMVLLSIFLQKLFDPDEDEDWSESSDNNSNGGGNGTEGNSGILTGPSLLLPKTSDFIDDVCNRASISGTEADQAACQDACGPALDCCNNSTCFSEEVVGCTTYAPCQALTGINDPTPADLDRLCSLESLQINRADCEFACSSMQCCYDDTVNACGSSQLWSCLDYAPCQNLRLPEGTAVEDSINFVGAAPAALDDECREEDGLCTRTCRDASGCCSDPQSACYRDNFISCLTYATCNQDPDSSTRVTLAPAYNSVPAAPDDLQDKCLRSQIDGNDAGKQACAAACEPAACCFEDGDSGCFGTDPLGCWGYQICTNLQE